MFSIICVYNKIDTLEKYLLKSLKNQSIDYELILLDNTYGKFSSAAEALNYGGCKANGQYLMFIHQDFQLSSKTWLEELKNYLDNLKDFGAAGIAGKHDKNLVSNIKNGIPPILAGYQITEPEEVMTVDECLVLTTNRLFEKINFDEVICDNWHLYGADYCLSVKKAGFKVYVLPMDGYHVSKGDSFTEETYYPILKKILKKYKNDYKWIYATTGNWSTVYPLSMQILYKKARGWI
jgi:GT2 family glycosyltransferase